MWFSRIDPDWSKFASIEFFYVKWESDKNIIWAEKKWKFSLEYLGSLNRKLGGTDTSTTTIYFLNKNILNWSLKKATGKYLNYSTVQLHFLIFSFIPDAFSKTILEKIFCKINLRVWAWADSSFYVYYCIKHVLPSTRKNYQKDSRDGNRRTSFHLRKR